MSVKLPEKFKDLEEFASEWAISSRQDRYYHRVRCPMEKLRRFYNAVTPRANAIVEYLNRAPLSELPESDLQLLWMMLAYMDASRAVEVIGAPDVFWGVGEARMKINDIAKL